MSTHLASSHDGLVAVVAHSMLNTLAVVAGTIDTVLGRPDLDEHERDQLLRNASRETHRLAEVVWSLASGSPAAAAMLARRPSAVPETACVPTMTSFLGLSA